MFNKTKLMLGVVSASIVSINIAAADYKCPYESDYFSEGDPISTSITFKVYGENDETQYKIYWLDYQGNRVFCKHLFAGDTYRQQTALTHPWVVTAPIPGGGEDCIDIYYAHAGGRTITLD